MANTYGLVLSNITYNSVDVTVKSATSPATTAGIVTVAIKKSGSTGAVTQNLADPGTSSGQAVGTLTFSSLESETPYGVYVSAGGTSTIITFTTKIDPTTPRSATQAQWEDLATKVKSKADNSAFTGTDGQTAGTAGLVPAPATTDAGKFLKADGTWDTAGGGGGDTVYSTKTTSNASNGGAVYIGNLDLTQTEQLDPTSTDNHYKYLWVLPYSNSTLPGSGSINIMGKPFSSRSNNVTIGKEARAEDAAIAIGAESQVNSNGIAIGYRANYIQGDNFNNYTLPIAIGYYTDARNYGIALGSSAKANNDYSIAIGNSAQCFQDNSIALGKGAYPTRQGELNIACDNTTAFNNTIYRVIGGVHDGQTDHDAVTLGQLNGRVKTNAGAPTTSTVGTVGQLLEDTTNGKLYQCTAVDTTDPQNPSYTWTEVGSGGGGGGPTVVQTTGTSQTDVMSQNATTSMIFGDPGTNNKIVIGTGASVSAQNYNMAVGTNADGNGVQSTAVGYGAKARPNGVALGYSAQAGTTNTQSNTVAIGQSAYGGGDHCTAVGDSSNTINSYSTAIGTSARARSERSVAIGASATVENSPAMAYSVALGANAVTSRAGEVNVGTGASNVGYNSTSYRVIGGVHDGVDTHDAATVGQLNGLITMTTTSPTEGDPLAANTFIAVYNAS